MSEKSAVNDAPILIDALGDANDAPAVLPTIPPVPIVAGQPLFDLAAPGALLLHLHATNPAFAATTAGIPLADLPENYITMAKLMCSFPSMYTMLSSGMEGFIKIDLERAILKNDNTAHLQMNKELKAANAAITTEKTEIANKLHGVERKLGAATTRVQELEGIQEKMVSENVRLEKMVATLETCDAKITEGCRMMLDAKQNAREIMIELRSPGEKKKVAVETEIKKNGNHEESGAAALKEIGKESRKRVAEKKENEKHSTKKPRGNAKE